ncbi:hypothetical protein ACOMHN_037625 [Nucella lapillus]
MIKTVASNKSKNGFEIADDSLDDLLGDLLEPDETPKKKAAQGRSRPAGKTGSGGKDDFYSNLAAMAENNADSDMSDADVGKMAKSIAGLDDMDADLFGDNLHKKNSAKGGGGKGSKPTTPRRGPTTPRTGGGEGGVVVSPGRSHTPTSPPGSARSGSLKRKPVKPSSSSAATAAPVNMQPPGTAPGKMTDLGRASENLRPGQSGKENQRPGTVPRVKKFDFGDFDQDDPLAGLSLDEDSVSEKKPVMKIGASAATASAAAKQKSADEDVTKPAQPGSPRKPSLFDRPPTRSGSGTANSEAAAEPPTPAKPAEPAAPKRKEETIFSDDDNFLDGLGIDADEKKPAAAPAVSPAPAASAPRAQSMFGGDEDSKPARSVLDGLLGRGQKTTSSLLDTKEKPRTFVLDKKYTQPKEEKKEEEEDFLFGSYQPSAAGSTTGGSRPGSRRSVRFQDDDDIFGLDKPSGGRRASATHSVPDDMKWLEELTGGGGGGGESTPSSNRSAPTANTTTPSSPAKRPTSPVKNSSTDKPSESMTKAGGGLSAKDNLLSSLAKSSPREASPERKPDPSSSAASKLDSKDWLGLKDSDSDGELFIPKRVASRSPGVVDSTPRTPSSATRPGRGTPKTDLSPTRETTEKKSDDDDEDSFIARAKARRQAALGQQAKERESAGAGAGDPSALVTKPESPRFEGSVPSALKGGGEDTRDLFGIPPTRTTISSRFDSSPRRSPRAGLASAPDLDALKLAQPQGVGSQSPGRGVGSQSPGRGGGRDMGQVLQSTHYTPPPGKEHQGVSFSGEEMLSGGYLGTPQGPIPSSLQDALAQLRKLEIEKQYSDSLLESTRKRYEEEIMAIERSYRNRMQILEESNQKSESRLRGEAERLMEEHLVRMKRLEQEKADLAAENFRRLEDQERIFAQESEKLKEKHRQAVQGLKREHEENQQQLVEAKNKEILKVASSHDTSRTLSAVVEQIESNARDLGQLQLKLDEWGRSGLDEREIAFRSKDEQLKMLQARLVKQEEDNEKERHRLEDLIARMESQNREQLRQLEEERWKVKQEHSRVDAQQQTLEKERRTWAEQHARERQSLDKARDMFLEEQQSGLSHLTDERRNLAEERSKLNMEQKLHREKVQQESVRLAQAKAEYDVLCQAISEEKAQAADRVRELRREEERISAERDRFHDRTAALEHEKQRLEKVALSVKHRSAELDTISEDANRAHEHGERKLAEARLLHSQLDPRQTQVEALQANVKSTEEHLVQEKLRLAKEKKDVENLKQTGVCINCRNMFQGAPHQVMHKAAAGSLLAGTTHQMGGSLLAGGPPVPSGPAPLQGGVGGMTLSAVMYESIASSIASDRAVRMWKIQALKDQEYLEEESMFLEGLRHSPYHSNSKV